MTRSLVTITLTVPARGAMVSTARAALRRHAAFIHAGSAVLSRFSESFTGCGFVFGLVCDDVLSRIRDATLIHGGEHRDQALLDHSQIVQRDAAVVELALLRTQIDQPCHLSLIHISEPTR